MIILLLDDEDGCAGGEFRCNTGSTCVMMSYLCDGDNDCSDGSDERNCTKDGSSCLQGQFGCFDGTCIRRSFACDGDEDCPDGSDEKNCTSAVSTTPPESSVTEPTSCPNNGLRCADGVCIPASFVCDGEVDCPDGSEEVGCPSKTPATVPESVTRKMTSCPNSGFLCGTGVCIHDLFVCDGDEDCPDGSDEQNCSATTESQLHAKDAEPEQPVEKVAAGPDHANSAVLEHDHHHVRESHQDSMDLEKPQAETKQPEPAEKSAEPDEPQLSNTESVMLKSAPLPEPVPEPLPEQVKPNSTMVAQSRPKTVRLEQLERPVGSSAVTPTISIMLVHMFFIKHILCLVIN